MDHQHRSSGHYAPANGASNEQRLPTVTHALPYTPFASIVPFSLGMPLFTFTHAALPLNMPAALATKKSITDLVSEDVIPAPQTYSNHTTSVFATTEERIAAHQTLQQLSSRASTAEDASRRLQSTLRDVQQFLNPDSLTQFKFKAPIRLRHTPDTISVKPQPHLTPFAKMVLDNTNVQYRYLTPESPTTPPVNQAAVVTGKTTVFSSMQSSHSENAHPSSHKRSSASQLVSSAPRSLQAIVVSTTLTPAQRAEYQVYSEQDSTAGAADSSPISRRHIPNGTQILSVDQRQKAEAAVQNLQTLMSEIFEAEDQLQPDTSGNVSTAALAFFTTGPNGAKSMIMQPTVQARLDSAVQKVIVVGHLDSLPVDSLARIQKLCETTVSMTETLRLHIGEVWTDQDIEDWLQHLEMADHALYACRTVLRIMNACRHEKELFSEELLRTTLTSLKHVVETCIIPIVEARNVGKEVSDKFRVASAHRKPLIALLQAATKTLRLFGLLLGKTEVDETSFTAAEYFCKSLIFTENAASEKDAALGIRSFENMRLCAMDVLASIFTRYTEQRQFIFDEILTSLEKLPANRQNARHYKLIDGKPIQLVSALLMRLVQTSATRVCTAQQLKSKTLVSHEEEKSDDDVDESSDDADASGDYDVSPTKKRTADTDLLSLSKPLYDAAQSNVAYVVKILIQRALTTSKSSDEPYRKLLDIFTEDFLSVLGSIDWPAAELFLRNLLSQMLGIVKGGKSAAPAKTLALELLGTMGSGILELQMQARNAARNLVVDQSDLSAPLVRLCDDLEQADIAATSLLAFEGPYRVVYEYLQARDVSDAQLQTARGFLLTQWAHQLCNGRESSADVEDNRVPLDTEDMQAKLRSMILDAKWLEDRFNFPAVSTANARLAAQVLTLSSSFCRAFNTIFNLLLASMNSEQITVRSRSLKSVVTVLDKDPSVLDRNNYVMGHIYKCANDPSPLVRESALGLIATCLSLRPRMDSKASERIIERSKDASVGVRKRAMKMLKDVYLRTDKAPLRSALANALLSRMQDTDESVEELARTIMEEIWFLPFHSMKMTGDPSVQSRLHFCNQVSLLVRTVEEDEAALQVLGVLVKQALSSTSKFAAANLRVCKELVNIMSDGIIDSTEIPEQPSQQAILRTLTVFAKASPKLFAPAQLERLEPYTQNLSNSDDLGIFRCVLVILRHVMPHVPSLQQGFLLKIQSGLLSSVAKLPKLELAEVAPCLWSIGSVLKNTERLVLFMISVVAKIHVLRSEDIVADTKKASQLIRLINIAGQFGKACDFQDHAPAFHERFPSWDGDSVAGLVVDMLCLYTSPNRPLAVREAALESICLTGQAWPNQFLRTDVASAMQLVFQDRVPSLEHVLLQGLEGFFCSELDAGQEPQGATNGAGVESGTARLGNTYMATDLDNASAGIAQQFLQQMLRIALSSCDEIALTATRIIASINRQGLVHPKESGPALVALETCPNVQIATLAFQEHRALHSKHESMFEKEYMRAVQRAFTYQQDVIGSTTGFTGNPPTAKMQLLWEVLKTGNAKVRKKFFSNLTEKLDFDAVKLDIKAQMPTHVLFVRFCLENLAFFEYNRVDELLHLLTCLEKTFAATGTGVAQAIESDVLKLRVESGAEAPTPAATSSDVPTAGMPEDTVDPMRLRRLTVSAQVLSLIWETRNFLVKQWNLQKLKQASKTKSAAKDINKAPNKAGNASTLTDAYLNRIEDVLSALSTTATQLALCNNFVELFSVDNEAKLGSEAEDLDLANGYHTPSEGVSAKSPSAPPGGSGRARKRKSANAASTPRKKQRAGSKRPSVGRRKSNSAKHDEGEDGGWE